MTSFGPPRPGNELVPSRGAPRRTGEFESKLDFDTGSALVSEGQPTRPDML